MDPTTIFSNYDLSSYMFNSNNHVPFHFNWFMQDCSYKRGGTAPTNANRNSMRGGLRPGFDNTIYKFNARNSLNTKDSNTNVIKLNDIKKISKIYNSTNIKPDKYTRKKPFYHPTPTPTPPNPLSTKVNPYSSRSSLTNPKIPCRNHDFSSRPVLTSSQSLRKAKSSNETTSQNLWISDGLGFKGSSYFLRSSTANNIAKEGNNLQCTVDKEKQQAPVMASEPQIYSYAVDLEIKKPTEGDGGNRIDDGEGNIMRNDDGEGFESSSSSFEEEGLEPKGENTKTQENMVNMLFNETVHTDASSEPDHEEDEEEGQRNIKTGQQRMFLTAEHFRGQEGKQEMMIQGKEDSESSLQLIENNDYIEENPALEREEHSILQSKLFGMNRPKTSEGGRRRRIVTNNDKEALNTNKAAANTILRTQEKTENTMEKEEEEEEIIFEKKPINLEYIQSLQNQRPPCRKKVQAFNLDSNFEKNSMRNFANVGKLIDRPPSRHKTPPKAVGLDIPNTDQQSFPIKNMYLKFEENNGNREDNSFNGLDLVKLENKVNLSNFEDKKQKNTKTAYKDEQKSEIIEDMSKKEKIGSTKNTHPFSASGFNNNRGIKKYSGIAKNNILNDKALTNNFMNAKIPRKEPVEIVINHNKSAAPKQATNNNVQVPFETSLGSDFLSLFANVNLEGSTPRKKEL